MPSSDSVWVCNFRWFPSLPQVILVGWMKSTNELKDTCVTTHLNYKSKYYNQYFNIVDSESLQEVYCPFASQSGYANAH